MAQQVKTITSETLEAAYRALTPSQDGFTEDLMASNTIIPVLDMTPAAEGTSTPEFLQRAFDYSETEVSTGSASESTLTSTPGFYQINYRVLNSGGSNAGYSIRITDGVTPKIVWSESIFAGTSQNGIAPIIFVASGNTMTWLNGTG